jgi:hypothetical protein
MVELQSGEFLLGLREVRKGDVFRVIRAGEDAGPWLQARAEPFARPHPKHLRFPVWNVNACPAPC